jgi:DNA repair exonuclease SbcCD ATPase subunit
MDERKTSIREYEDKKREALNSIEGMLENLGASVLPRREQDDDSEYRRLSREIRDSEVFITAIEGDIARLTALEEEIQRKDQENDGRARDISKLFTRLGESALAENAGVDEVKPYQDQAEALLTRIKSLEERLLQLEERGDRNVFAWIGKNTQGMVLRSFLAKNRNNLQRIYTLAGEKYSQSVSAAPPPPSGIAALFTEIEAARQDSAVLGADLARLREERRRIGDAFVPDGGPAKKIQALERGIARSREELRGVFLRYGRELEASPESRAAPLDEADAQLLANIRRGREAVLLYDTEIEKLKASLAIDGEKAAIARMEKAVEEHEERIRSGEEAIANLKVQIEEAQARIAELTRVL